MEELGEVVGAPWSVRDRLALFETFALGGSGGSGHASPASRRGGGAGHPQPPAGSRAAVGGVSPRSIPLKSSQPLRAARLPLSKSLGSTPRRLLDRGAPLDFGSTSARGLPPPQLRRQLEQQPQPQLQPQQPVDARLLAAFFQEKLRGAQAQSGVELREARAAHSFEMRQCASQLGRTERAAADLQLEVERLRGLPVGAIHCRTPTPF